MTGVHCSVFSISDPGPPGCTGKKNECQSLPRLVSVPDPLWEQQDKFITKAISHQRRIPTGVDAEYIKQLKLVTFHSYSLEEIRGQSMRGQSRVHSAAAQEYNGNIK